MPLLILHNFVLNLLLSQKFFVPLQTKSKTYGMRRTPIHITPLGSVNVADHIAAIGTKASEGGLPIQYYAPYGELIANQQMIGYDERYKFTGKERDAEQLANIITTESNQWQKDAANEDVSIIFLYACHAGEGENCLAQQL